MRYIKSSKYYICTHKGINMSTAIAKFIKVKRKQFKHYKNELHHFNYTNHNLHFIICLK